MCMHMYIHPNRLLKDAEGTTKRAEKQIFVEGCKHMVEYAALRSSLLGSLQNYYSSRILHRCFLTLIAFSTLLVTERVFSSSWTCLFLFAAPLFLLWGGDLHACAAFDLVPLPSSWKPHLKSVPGKAPSTCLKPSSRPEWTPWPRGWSGGCGTTWWKGQLEADQVFFGCFSFFSSCGVEQQNI